MGKGDINIRTKSAFMETISNFFYVPNLKQFVECWSIARK